MLFKYYYLYVQTKNKKKIATNTSRDTRYYRVEKIFMVGEDEEEGMGREGGGEGGGGDRSGKVGRLKGGEEDNRTARERRGW